MTKEIWKQIKEFPNYSVSNHGNVRNDKTGKILKKQKVGLGSKDKRYSVVCLFNQKLTQHQKWVYVAHLVANAFIPISDDQPNVGFKDFNRDNCHVDNIYRSTQSEIIKNSWRAGRCRIKRANAKLTLTKARKIRKSNHLTAKELGKIYGVSENAISKVRTERTWKESIANE
jgi:DNA-binding XRE family transcriptional regulator